MHHQVKIIHRRVSLCSTPGGWGVTPDASWDRSHGHGGGGSVTPPPPPVKGQPPPLARVKGQPPPPPGQGQRSTELPPWKHTGTMVNGRAVRILLECILDWCYVPSMLIAINIFLGGQLLFYGKTRQNSLFYLYYYCN